MRRKSPTIPNVKRPQLPENMSANREEAFAQMLAQQSFTNRRSVHYLGTFRSRHSQFWEYRLDDGEETGLVVKQVLNWRGGTPAEVVNREFNALTLLAEKARSVDRGRFPAPLMVLPRESILVLKKLWGPVLIQLMKKRGHRLAKRSQRGSLALTARQVGEWLAWFHDSTQQSATHFQAAQYLSKFREALDRCVSAIVPADVRESVRLFAHNTATQANGRLCRAAARHGDFIPQNVIVGRNDVAIIDFENFFEKDFIYEDLGAFVAYLSMMRGSPFYSRSALHDMIKAFLHGYGTGIDADMLSLYVLKAALIIIGETRPPSGILSRWRTLFPLWKRLVDVVAWAEVPGPAGENVRREVTQ